MRHSFLRTLAAGLAALFALATVGCAHAGHDEPFQWTTQLPAGTVVHFRNGDGNVTVRRASGSSVLVNGARRWNHGHARDVQFVVQQDGSDYYVCAMWRNGGTCGAKGYRGNASGGFLAMLSLFHRRTDARADLVAELPAGVVVDARTVNGSVDVDGLSAGVVARSTNGAVTASHVSGPIALSTVNGSIRLSADSLAADDSVHLVATNGTVQAQLPPNLQGNFDLSNVNGGVRSDLPLESISNRGVNRHHLRGQIGTSARVVKLHTVNGSVSLVTTGATPAPATPATPAAPVAPAAAR